MDELPVLMEKLRKAKNLRQLHLDLNKPGKEVQLSCWRSVLDYPDPGLLIVFRCPVTDNSGGSLVRFGGNCNQWTAGAIAKLGKLFRVLYGA
ncbi:hypothetical protein pipiens_009090 [Culex pipiens pipiens]|uniref:Uncharacterized protein n=1 Tax=Culex pipiens pipiens TaxID=38569 RepID=A0ABD1DH07_CULPP